MFLFLRCLVYAVGSSTVRSSKISFTGIVNQLEGAKQKWKESRLKRRYDNVIKLSIKFSISLMVLTYINMLDRLNCV